MSLSCLYRTPVSIAFPADPSYPAMTLPPVHPPSFWPLLLDARLPRMTSPHLVQVPTFEKEIEFVQLDVNSAATLHCECTKGVEVSLRKIIDGPEVNTLNVSVPLDEALPSTAKFAWRVVNVTFAWAAQEQRSSPRWLVLREWYGLEQDKMQLMMSPAFLGEVTEAEPFTAEVEVEVTDPADGSTRNMTIPVMATVRADAVAAMSAWGSTCGPLGALPPTKASFGSELSAEFTSCDVDGLRTAHRLPLLDDMRAYEVVVVREGLSSAAWAPPTPLHVAYNGGYRAVWSNVDAVGTFLLQLRLGGEDAGAPLRVVVTCPDGLEANADGTGCVCPAGWGCDPTGVSADRKCPGTRGGQCTKCSRGTSKAIAANSECDLCAKGTFAGGEGAASCTPCLPGYLAASTGSESCASCGERLSSLGGAEECSVCARGYFTESVAVKATATTCKPCWEAASCATNTTVCESSTPQHRFCG